MHCHMTKRFLQQRKLFQSILISNQEKPKTRRSSKQHPIRYLTIRLECPCYHVHTSTIPYNESVRVIEGIGRLIELAQHRLQPKIDKIGNELTTFSHLQPIPALFCACLPIFCFLVGGGNFVHKVSRTISFNI